MAAYRRMDDCGLTVSPGSVPGPTLGNEYGKPLPLPGVSALWFGQSLLRIVDYITYQLGAVGYHAIQQHTILYVRILDFEFFEGCVSCCQQTNQYTLAGRALYTADTQSY